MQEDTGYYKWVMIFIGCLFAIIDMSTLSIFSMTAEEITKQLGVTLEYANAFGPWGSLGLFGIWSVGQVLGFLLGGPLYDRIGFKKTLLIAGVCLIVPQFVIPWVSSFWVVWFLRLVQGFCNVAFVPIIIVSIGWFGAEKGTLALGFFIGALLAGGTIGNFLAALASYPGNYYIVGVICVISIALVAIFGKPSPVAVGAAMVEEEAAAPKEEEAVGWGTVLVLKDTWILAIALLCATIMLYPFFAGFGSFALKHGVTSSQVAGGSLALTILFVIFAVATGAITTRLCRKRNPLKAQSAMVMTGFLLMIIGSVLMATLGKAGFIGWFIACFIFFPLGMGTMMPTFNVMPPLIFPAKVAGTGTGVVTFFGNIINWATPGIFLGLIASIGWAGYWLLITPFMILGAILMLVVYRRAGAKV